MGIDVDMDTLSDYWKTKPSDRFVLKWIKIHLSARITPMLVNIPWMKPWMITIGSASIGVIGGILFGLGWAWLAGMVAAVSQVLDGVDGQFARLTKRQSTAGAFLDSVLDRYPDGAMVIGMVIYLIRLPLPIPFWPLLIFGYLAISGSNLISYSSAKADSLGIDIGKPTLASKGTRSSVMILCALGSLIWPSMPALALGYLVIHPNTAVMYRLFLAFKSSHGETQ